MEGIGRQKIIFCIVYLVAKATLSKKSQEELLLEEALFGSTAAAKASQFASVPKQHHLSVDDSNTESDISVADESDVEEEDEINV